MAENTPTVKMNVEADFKTPLKMVKRVGIALSESSNTPETPATKKQKTLTIPASPFLQRLGYGTGVSVFLMNRPETPGGLLKSPWAVKRLNKRCCNGRRSEGKSFEKRLSYEAGILKRIKHENIIGYRDTVRDADGNLCLCMERGDISLGILVEQRMDECLGPFSPENIHKVIHSVSNALAYLHNTENLLHGDLKSHNILIKEDFLQVKLCDFGVCLKLKPDLQGLADDMDIYCGTEAWSSKEALDEGLITDRADIYSLGCVVYEMISLNVPHCSPLLSGEEDYSFDEDAFLDALGSVPVLPDTDYDEAYYPYMALMKICCREDAKARPSAEEIVSTLDVLENSLASE